MDRISVNPEVCNGKPCIRGTRIMVAQILDLLEAGKSFQQIVTDYFPDLQADDIKACLQFARHLVDNEEIHVVEERALR